MPCGINHVTISLTGSALCFVQAQGNLITERRNDFINGIINLQALKSAPMIIA